MRAQIRRTVLGWEHPATANSLNNIGGLLMGQGKVEEAAKAFRESLSITETVRARPGWALFLYVTCISRIL